MSAVRNMILSLTVEASNYTKGMKLAQAETRSTQKELQLWAEQNMKTSNSVAYLIESTKKMKDQQPILAKQIELTNSKLQEQITKFGKTSIEAVNAKNKLIDLEIAQTKLNNSIKKQPSQILNNIGTKMKDTGMASTMAYTLPMAAGLTAISKLGIDAVESENLFDVSFGKMANQARQWSETTSKALGLNQYDLRKTAGTYDVMLKSMGMTEQSAYDMSTNLVTLGNDMASFYNIPIDVAMEKLRSGITGEVEPLKQLGINVNETMTKQYAWSHGIAENGKELTENQKVLARYGTIMQMTSAAQGDLARTADSPANMLRRVSNEAKEAGISLGIALIPTISSALKGIVEFTPKVKGVIDGFNAMSPTARNTAIGFIAVTMAIPPLIMGIGGITTAIGSMMALTPVGWISLLAGAYVAVSGTVLTYNAIQNQANDTWGNARAEAESLKKTLQEYKNQVDSQVNAERGHIAVVEQLLPQLDNLSSKTIKTASDKENMKSIIDRLNGAIPDLITNYDAETGALGTQIGVVRDSIDVYKQLILVKAAEKEADEAGSKLLSARRIIDDVNANRLEMPQQFVYSNIANRLIVNIEYQSQLDAYNKQIQALQDANITAGSAQEIINNAASMRNSYSDKYGNKYDFGKAKVAYNTPIATTANAISGGNSAANQAENNLTKVKDAVTSYIDKLKSATEANRNFATSLERFVEKGTSITRMISSLSFNIKEMQSYRQGIADLKAKGLSDMAVQELIKKGPSAVAEVKALNRGSAEQLQRYNSLYADANWLGGQIGKDQLGNEPIYKGNNLNITITGNNIKDGYDIDSLVDDLIKSLKKKGVAFA